MFWVCLWVCFGSEFDAFQLAAFGIVAFERYKFARPYQSPSVELGLQAALEWLGPLVVLVLDFAFLGLVLTSVLPII